MDTSSTTAVPSPTVFDHAMTEAISTLRNILANGDPRDQIAAAEVLLKWQASGNYGYFWADGANNE